MNATDELKHALDASKTLAEQIGTRVSGLEAPGNHRSRHAGALLSIALDHHCGIITLIGRNLPASALALLRPLIDAYLRGAWLSYCASEAEVSAFTTGDDPPGTAKLIAALEELPEYSDGLLSAIRDRIWGTVCDFTHGGGRLAFRYITDDGIEPNFPDVELIELLRAAESWAALSAIAIADLARREDVAEWLLQVVADRQSTTDRS